ncbi:hypothetical protein NDU88_001669 [Pleurodeles waltl]|uniref:Uncharacterized protein n=1 Tax=Pleurodeles waltl TaxID=8319 RepID=A0AAV7NBF0_PLEWA|nr:hypothetical protein NDU88_001669 [Pleurodeles waltl]
MPPASRTLDQASSTGVRRGGGPCFCCRGPPLCYSVHAVHAVRLLRAHRRRLGCQAAATGRILILLPVLGKLTGSGSGVASGERRRVTARRSALTPL